MHRRLPFCAVRISIEMPADALSARATPTRRHVTGDLTRSPQPAGRNRVLSAPAPTRRRRFRGRALRHSGDLDPCTHTRGKKGRHARTADSVLGTTASWKGNVHLETEDRAGHGCRPRVFFLSDNRKHDSNWEPTDFRVQRRQASVAASPTVDDLVPRCHDLCGRGCDAVGS